MTNQKLKVLVLSVLCLVEICVSHTISDHASLDSDLCAEEHDIDKMLPLSDILNDILAAYRYDPEVRAAFEHIGSQEFKEKTDRLERRDEYQAFIIFCRANNLRIPELFAFLKTVLPTLVKQSASTDISDAPCEQISGGVHGLIRRIFEQRVPMKDIEKCFHAQLQCDPGFKAKIDSLHSIEFRTVLKNLRSTSEYNEVIQDLEAYKIYFDTYLNLMLDYFEIPY